MADYYNDFNDEDDGGIEFRSEISGPSLLRRLRSTVSSIGREDAEMSDQDDDDDSYLRFEKESPVSPLFLHLTSTVRKGEKFLCSSPVPSLPTCLSEAVQCLQAHELDVSDIKVCNRIKISYFLIPSIYSIKNQIKFIN